MGKTENIPLQTLYNEARHNYMDCCHTLFKVEWGAIIAAVSAVAWNIYSNKGALDWTFIGMVSAGAIGVAVGIEVFALMKRRKKTARVALIEQIAKSKEISIDTIRELKKIMKRDGHIPLRKLLKVLKKEYRKRGMSPDYGIVVPTFPDSSMQATLQTRC